MVRSLAAGVCAALGGLLLLGFLLLLLLHLTRAAGSRGIRRMREQLLCLISGAAGAKRMKNRILEMTGADGGMARLSDIHGICSARGLIAMTETATELSGAAFEKLRAQAGGAWYGVYLKKLLTGAEEEPIALVIRLVGTLRLADYLPDVVTQIYIGRKTARIQQAGLFTLCRLGAEREIIALCRDHTIASVLPFRALEEIFSVYTGDLERLCRRLITSASDPYIRRTCIKAIGEQGYGEMYELVLPHLTRGAINTRIDAARTLGQIGCKAALPQLLASAGDEHWELRAVVATALGALDARGNADTLIGLLCDGEWWVRYRAAEALAKAGDAESLMERVERTGDRFAAEMMRFALDSAALLSKEAA